jgi:hypothetical protein
MTYQSHHCSARFFCSVCLTVFLHTSIALLFFCFLCSVHHSHPMHFLSSVHFSCCTQPPSSHLHHSQQQQQPNHFFFFFHLLMPPVHLVHALYAMVLHALHVECSASSSWKLLHLSFCLSHVSIITGCHHHMPSHPQQLRFFILCYSRAQLICCSYKLQRSSSYQLSPQTVFIPLADSL